MKRSTIVEIISAMFILLFVYTAINKFMEGARFENTLSKSPLIGDYAGLLSWSLPAVEIAVAILLLVPKTRLLGLYASTALMVLFTLYIGYMIAFTPKLPCSCGGVLKEMTWKQHLFFNIFFSLLGWWGSHLQKRNETGDVEPAAVPLKEKYS
jgi:putative oxidoreductase